MTDTTIVPDGDASGQSADELRYKLAAIQASHQEFRKQVRNRAIRGFHDGEWEMDSLNAALGRLDLAEYEPKRVVRTVLRLEVVLEADTDDVVRAWSVVQDLEHLRAQEAFKEAITGVVQARLSEDLAFTPAAGVLSATVTYPRVENA
jgi:hypothetical protein